MNGPRFDLDGASILVVGASGGLGRPLSHSLALRGARLTLAGRDLGRLGEVGLAGATLVAGDITDPATPDRFVAAAVDAYGRLDGVVSVAGVVAFGPLGDLSDATLRELVEVNVVGPIRLVRAAIPHLSRAVAEPRDDGSRSGQAFVLAVSGAVVESPTAGMAAYAASKAALAGFDAALARELRPARIRVVDARPPHTETGLAGRPIAGSPPSLPRGLDPAVVAERLVKAIVDGERDLPAAAFVTGS